MTSSPTSMRRSFRRQADRLLRVACHRNRSPAIGDLAAGIVSVSTATTAHCWKMPAGHAPTGLSTPSRTLCHCTLPELGE